MESAKKFSARPNNGHLQSGILDISTSGKRSLPSYDQIIRDRYGMTNPSWGEKERFQRDHVLNSRDFQFEPEERIIGRNNPFIPESSVEISFPYSSRRRSIERTKWLAYAKSLRPGLNRKGSSSSSSNSGDNRYWGHSNHHDSSFSSYSEDLPPRPQSVQSDILHHHRNVYPPRPNSVQSEVIRAEEFYSPRPASVQSEIIHDAYGNHRYRNHKRYHSTQSLNRPSRRMFSSGLRVRFSDEVDNNSRNAHLELEPTEISHYDKKIRELFDQRYKRQVKKRYSSESPTPTTSGSDSDDTVGPHSQLENLGSVQMGNLERSVHIDHSNIQSPTNNFSGMLDVADRTVISQQEGLVDTMYDENVLEQESDTRADWNSPQFYRDFQYNMYFDRPVGQKLLHLATSSPPDSAIDLDSSSVQSALSLDLHLASAANEIPSDISLYPSAIKQTDLSLDRTIPSQASVITDSMIGQQRKPQGPSDINHSYLTSGNQIDSDVDSGISQEPSNNGLGLLWSSKQTANGNHGNRTARPASAVPFLSHGGLQQNNTSSDEDDSIMREIQHTNVENLRNLISQNVTYGIPEDEVDDTDPSFGISVVKDDKTIQENYLQKRNPTRFVIRTSISSSRCRPQSAPTWGGSKGDFISNNSIRLRKGEQSSQLEVLHNGEIGSFEHGTEIQRKDQRDYNEYYHVNTEDFDEQEFFTEAEGGYSTEKFVLDRRKLSQASNSDASTLSNGHFSNQDGGSTWREMVGYDLTTGEQHGPRLNRETEEEIRMHSRSNPSVEENESTQDRAANLPYARSHSYDRNLQVVASEEFPEISDKSAKKKFHFNIFKTKRGKYRPDFANNTQTLHSILKKPKQHEHSRSEIERCRSENDLLDDRHVDSSYHGSMSAENLLGNDLYANQKKISANKERRNEFLSSSSSKSPVVESNGRKFPGDKRNEIENLTSVYPQLLSPEIFRNERPVAVKLDQSDIQQLDDMYDFSDEDDDEDDNEDDNEDDSYEDEDVSGSQAVYPAEIEEAANLPTLHEEEIPVRGIRFDSNGSIYANDESYALQDKKLTSFTNLEDSEHCVKSPTLKLSASPDLEKRERTQDVVKQNEHQQPIANERFDLIHDQQPIENVVSTVGGHVQPTERSIRSMSNDSLPEPIGSDVISLSDEGLPHPIGRDVRSMSNDSLPQQMGSDVRSMSNDSLPQPIENNKTSLSTHDPRDETSRKFLSTENLQVTHEEPSRCTGKKGKPLKREFSFSEPNLYTITDEISLDGNQASCTLPDHRYRGGQNNHGMNREISASKTSLSKFGNLKAAFKAKFKKGKKKDRGQNKSQQEADRGTGIDVATDQFVTKPPKAKKSGISLKKLFKKKGSKGRSTDVTDHSETPNTGLDMYGFPVQDPSEQPIREENYPTPPIRNVGDANGPISAEDGCCRLLEANPDGTQLIQLSRPQDGPIGLYIAKGNSKFTHGIYVSRFMENEDEDDDDPARDFGGILNIGDEILEINGYITMDMTLEDVYDLMCQRSVSMLKTLPYYAQRNV